MQKRGEMFMKTKYYLAFVLGGAVENYYNEMTATLESACGVPSLAKRQPAHITVIQPFFIDDEKQLKAVADVVREHVNTEPFSIDIQGFGWFKDHPNDQTAYLGVRPDVRLAAFAGRVAGELSYLLQNWVRLHTEYHPHVSLARNLTAEKAQEVERYLEGLRTVPPHFDDVLLDTLTLFRRRPHGAIYEIAAEFELRKNK